MLPAAREECTSSVMIGGVARLEPKFLTRLTTNQGTCHPRLLLSWTSVLSDLLRGLAPPWSSTSACLLRPPAPTFSLAQKKHKGPGKGVSPRAETPPPLSPLSCPTSFGLPWRNFLSKIRCKVFPLFFQSFHHFWLLSLTTSLLVFSVLGFHLTLPSSSLSQCCPG